MNVERRYHQNGMKKESGSLASGVAMGYFSAPRAEARKLRIDMPKWAVKRWARIVAELKPQRVAMRFMGQDVLDRRRFASDRRRLTSSS